MENDYDIAINIIQDYIRLFKDEGHQATVAKLNKLKQDIEEAINQKEETLDHIANDREMW